MATNTNSNTSKDTRRSGSGYQPSDRQYEPWDDDRGNFRMPDNGTDGLDERNNSSESYGKKNYNNDRDDYNNERGNHDNDRQSSAVGDLRDAENSAISNREPSYSEGQEKSKSYYTGNGGQSKTKIKSMFGKKGKSALVTIALILIGGGAFLSASNSLLAPALSALMTASTQTSFTSYALRAKFLTSGMMKGNGSAVKRNWYGSLKYSKIPNKLKSRLALQGIEVNGSGGNTTLTWKRTLPNGTIEEIPDITATKFVDMYNSNPEFRESYTRAKHGRVATFFDNVADKIYKKLGLSRNLFSNYRQSNNADTDAANYKSTMEPKFEGNKTTITSNGETEREVIKRDDDGNIIYKTDADGNPTNIPETEIEIVPDPKTGTATTGSETDIDAAKPKARSLIQDVAASVAQVGSVACTFMRIGNMIAITVAAQEIYQSINYFMGQMENVSKMKAGYGDESAINSFLNFLSTTETTKVDNFNNLNITITNTYQSAPSEDDMERNAEVQTGSPLESAGLQLMLTNTNGTNMSSRTSNYSIERVIKALGGAAAFGATTVGVCAGVDIANSLLSIGTAIATGGLSLVANFVSKVAFNIFTVVAASAFLSFLIPTVASKLFTNVFDTAIGIPAGELLAQGASAANTREGRSGSGQSLSDKNQALQFARATNTVLAMEAEQDRLNYSPFDATNRNTFLGSIAYSLLPILTTNKVTSNLSFLMRSTSHSLASLTGSVYASGEGETYTTSFGDCPLLDEIGAAGDLYCNPIITTDMSTIETDPSEDDYVKALMNSPNGKNLENCDSEGNCDIVPNSDLAKYIAFCDNRDSPFGVIDQNILGSMQPGLTNISIINAIPGIGDITSLINSGIDLTNLSWANGEKCGNTSQNQNFWDTEGKYYQRYVEDQRILEQMGAYEGSKNPVTAYEEKYEAELQEKYKDVDPIVAYYSRISGLTPENTETTLAFIYYYNFVDQYDPTIRIAMEGKTSDLDSGEEVIAKLSQERIHFDGNYYVESPLADQIIAHHEYIVYADIRNRSYAV